MSTELPFNPDTFKPTLLHPYKGQNIKDGSWIYQYKLDGCRAIYTILDGVPTFISRNGKNYVIPESFYKDFPEETLDGELYMGPKSFDKLSGLLRRKDKIDPDNWSDKIKFVVFDRPLIPGDYTKRMPNSLKFKSKNIIKISSFAINENTDLDKILKKVESEGIEGLVLRKITSEYQQKRTKDLLKYVSTYSSNVVIVGYTKGNNKYSEVVGAYIVKFLPGESPKVDKEAENKKDILFNVSGFTDELRHDPLEVGTVIRIKYREIYSSGIPRFPVFDGIRPPEDVENKI